jgi:hypothetical protein
VYATWELCEVAESRGALRRFARLKDVVEHCETVTVADLFTDFSSIDELATAGVVRKVEFDLTRATEATFQRTLTIDRGTEWKASTSIELPDFGLKIGPSYRGKKSFKTVLDFELPSGWRYVAVLLASPAMWFWEAQK